ncbi:HalOD1 output domain-containing protein [Halomontanus rarus]|uniref:HalOD1 output domain-containing protein n=1 Tax=Halomontanus rarus TaxID=3034020 RepID=UPI0023E8D1D6|nr:HalOD1 output domain-containing protein [Halovivax sp. TS33]
MANTSARPTTRDASNDGPIIAEATWDRESENTPVYAVVTAVAAAHDSDPVELPPLADSINPDALNDLFLARGETTVGQLDFHYLGYRVVVHGDGAVRVHS